MKNGNLLAASLIAATFVLLAVLPLTREAVRFDMQMAAGKPLLGSTLTDLGVKQDSLPFGGFGPRIAASRDDVPAASASLPVRLANAMHLGREKWAALQQLVADFPDSPAAHAALARMACKNGGSVDVGHLAEQMELSSSPSPVRRSGSSGDPRDPAIMLRSCEAGERLDPDNAYFPAMAAVAYLATNQDSAAWAALHRAAEKPHWREYFEVEADGQIRRAELLHGPQNSLTESATMASMLFPHYAALRSMARIVTVQAMYAEQAGDVQTGLALRRDAARLGTTMREESSSLIGGLVGIAIIRITELRPGGAPLPRTYPDGGTEWQVQTDRQFIDYLATHGTRADTARWQQYISAGDATKAIVRRAGFVSVFGATTMFQTQWQLLTNLVLLGVATLLCGLGGVALVRPWLGQKAGRAASVVAVATFIAFLVWGAWHAIGNLRDILAFSGLINGLSSDSTADASLAAEEWETLLRTLRIEGAICLTALLTLPIGLGIAVRLAKRRSIPIGMSLSYGALPLAALMTLGYVMHLTAFSLRERVVRAELQQVIAHEGRYVAAKLGKAWPTPPEE